MGNEKRLIDAEVFSEHLERMARTAYPNLFPGLFEAAEYAKDFLTVDAVEVVRCKDCKHCNEGFCVGYHAHHDIMPDDFCSYGERKDGDVNG